jgi:hypothetical protein
MPDLVSIASAASGLQSVGQIVKSLIGLKISSDVQAKVIEFQGVIMGAQSDALAAQSEQFALLERIRSLEAEVAKAKAWDAEKARYELHEFPAGAPAYVLKPDVSKGEPPHRICPKCYNEGHKSLLQVKTKRNRGERVECDRCNSDLLLSRSLSRASRGILPYIIEVESGLSTAADTCHRQ